MIHPHSWKQRKGSRSCSYDTTLPRGEELENKTHETHTQTRKRRGQRKKREMDEGNWRRRREREHGRRRNGWKSGRPHEEEGKEYGHTRRSPALAGPWVDDAGGSNLHLASHGPQLEPPRAVLVSRCRCMSAVVVQSGWQLCVMTAPQALTAGSGVPTSLFSGGLSAAASLQVASGHRRAGLSSAEAIPSGAAPARPSHRIRDPTMFGMAVTSRHEWMALLAPLGAAINADGLGAKTANGPSRDVLDWATPANHAGRLATKAYGGRPDGPGVQLVETSATTPKRSQGHPGKPLHFLPVSGCDGWMRLDRRPACLWPGLFCGRRRVSQGKVLGRILTTLRRVSLHAPARRWIYAMAAGS